MPLVRSPRRHHDCEASFNLRDLGGYPTTTGHTVRWGLVFRADALHRSPQATADVASRLGWRTVLDLRTGQEREAGCFSAGGVEVLHLPVIRQTWDHQGLDREPDPVQYLTDRYLEMLDEGAGSLRRAVETLADPERLPAVFHCSAGKDRTGVLAALVLSVLGVADDHIAEDYHLTAPAMDLLVDWVLRNQPEMATMLTQQPKALLQCPPAAMHAFLAAVGHHHGSADGYLRGVGVAPETLDALRARLLTADDPGARLTS